MPFIHPRGNPNSKLWIIADAPFTTDIPKGFLFSGGMGFFIERMLKDAGITDYYATCRRPNTDDTHAFNIVENDLNKYKPPFVVLLGNVGKWFCKQLNAEKKGGNEDAQVAKYAGSLLTSNILNYEHYVMPMLNPMKLTASWKERNVTTFFDLQKLAAEIKYFNQTGQLQPLPVRELHFRDMQLDEILSHFRYLARSPILSTDIESIYTKKDSVFSPHPGYPTTISLACSPKFGISFNFFRESSKETLILWRELDRLMQNKMILGQNFFEFDAPRLRSLGFSIANSQIIDTKIRHHVLWPELSHTLQFQTRQYTREPYYKDEGKAWNHKDMTKLRRYNCLDTTVTFEVYLEQETEFAEREYLR